ncbi:MAG: phosphatase PAP2 family protein [Clostridia bacterium]|nr:phosphatase PAP2 family protein [Clostridia bacterium]
MEKLLTKVYKNRRLTNFFSLSSHIVSALCVVSILFALGYQVYLGKYLTAAILLVCAGTGFIAVSLVRRFIDAPRPYELYSLYEEKPKEREGRSFPSRHAYSAAVISVLSLSVSVWMCIPLLLLTIYMCVCRALIGIHFIRDLAAGVLIGALAGAIALLLI